MINLDDFTVLLSDSTPRFNFQYNKVHLTYPITINPDLYLDFASGLFESRQLLRYSIVTEKSNTDYIHTHVYLEWDARCHITNPKTFDYLRAHPNIRAVKTKDHHKNVLNYHRKTGAPVSTNIMSNEEYVKKRKRLDKMSVREVENRFDECDNDIQRFVEEDNLTLKERSSVISSYALRPIRIKPGPPPPITLPAPISAILDPPSPDSLTVYWYYSLDVLKNRELISLYENYIPGTFAPEISPYPKLATLAEKHYSRGGTFGNMFIEINSQDEIPKDFVTSLSRFKSGKIQGGQKSITLNFDPINIFIISSVLPSPEHMRRRDIYLTFIYENLSITRETASTYLSVREGELYFDFDKLSPPLEKDPSKRYFRK